MKKFTLVYLLFFFPFLISLLLKYNYVEFTPQGSLGVGYALTAESLSRDFSYSIDNYYGSAGSDVFEYNGHWYTAYAPLTSFLMAVPLSLSNGLIKILDLRNEMNVELINIINSFSTGIINSISLGLVSLFVYKILSKVYKIKDKRILATISIATVLSTILFNYSVSFINHPTTAFFIIASFYYFKMDKLKMVGVLLALSFLNEWPSILMSVGYGIVILLQQDSFRNRTLRILQIAYPVSFSIFIMLLFNYLLWGHPLNFPDVMLTLYKNGDSHNFSNSLFSGLYTGLFSPLKGLVWYFPVLIVSFFALLKYRKKYKDEFIIIVFYFLATLIVYSLWTDCWGASPLGPRYFSSVIPLLMIPIGWILYSQKSDILMGLVIIWATIYFLLAILNVIDGLVSSKFLDCRLSSFDYYRKSFSVLIGTNRFVSPVLLKFIQ